MIVREECIEIHIDKERGEERKRERERERERERGKIAEFLKNEEIHFKIGAKLEYEKIGREKETENK